MQPAPPSASASAPAVSARRLLQLLALYALLWLACVQGALWFGDLTRWRLQLQSLAYPALLLLMFFSPLARGGAAFLLSTIMEVLAPVCVASRRFALAWLVFISVFHLLSLLTLSILFWENTIMFWLLLSPVGLWLARRSPGSPAASPDSATSPA